jgi:hypothetical protein
LRAQLGAFLKNMTSMVITGTEHPVHVLLNHTAKAVSTQLAGKFLACTKPAPMQKGGMSHG